MDDLVLTEVVSDFVIQVVEADYSYVVLSDSSVVYIPKILYEKVGFPVLVDESLLCLEEKRLY